MTKPDDVTLPWLELGLARINFCDTGPTCLFEASVDVFDLVPLEQSPSGQRLQTVGFGMYHLHVQLI